MVVIGDKRSNNENQRPINEAQWPMMKFRGRRNAQKSLNNGVEGHEDR